MKTTITIRLQVEGVHRWAKCPHEDVKFLRDFHRHIFYIECEKQVFHDDRDVEFIQFKRELEKLYNTGVMQLDYKSCEMMAQDLAKYIQSKYANRDLIIDISEDGENGCVIEYSRD